MERMKQGEMVVGGGGGRKNGIHLRRVMNFFLAGPQLSSAQPCTGYSI